MVSRLGKAAGFRYPPPALKCRAGHSCSQSRRRLLREFIVLAGGDIEGGAQRVLRRRPIRAFGLCVPRALPLRANRAAWQSEVTGRVNRAARFCHQAPYSMAEMEEWCRPVARGAAPRPCVAAAGGARSAASGLGMVRLPEVAPGGRHGLLGANRAQAKGRLDGETGADEADGAQEGGSAYI